MILSLLAAFNSLAPAALHSAPTRIISPIQRTLPWTGHFAAKNFKQTRNDRLRLSFAKKQIRETILALPKWHTDALDTLEIRNEAHVSRGLSNAKKIILHTSSIETTDELKSVFIHELGHIVDLGALKGSRGKKTRFKDGNIQILSDDPSIKFYEISWTSSNTQNRNTNSKDFVSGYAQSDCFEDFAESYLMYRMHGARFRSLAKNSPSLQKKYNFMKTNVFGNTEFELEKIETIREITFDTTLLAIDELKPLAVR